MWTTLGLVAALSLAPGQTAAELNLANIRTTYGFLGAPRPDNKLIPGDAFVVAFDIENVKVDDTGKVLYSMAMEVVDSKNKPQFKQDPANLEAMNSLGGKRLPALAHVFVGLDQPKGTYTLKVTVTDRATKASKSFSRDFEVEALRFGLVRAQLSNDPNQQIMAPPVAVAGQSLFVNFNAVGFKRGPKGDPNLTVEMQVLDDKDAPTLAKPFIGEVTKDLPKDIIAVPMQFQLWLNRPGKFTVRLRATDNVTKEKAEMSLPLTVLESK